jgi:type I restriction enzyme S subunit
VDKYILPANTNQAVAIIRVNQNIINPYVIYSYLLAGWQNVYYFKNIQQAVQANLSLASIGNLPILIPHKGHLDQYQEIIAHHLDLIFSNNNQSRALASLRDALLPKLMSGEIAVPKEDVNFEIK